MRYRLRTLLILLPLSPPTLAAAWLARADLASILVLASKADPLFLISLVALGIIIASMVCLIVVRTVDTLDAFLG